MTKSNSKPAFDLKKFLHQFGVYLIMLSYPLASLLWRHQYPWLSPEVFLFITSTVLVALLLALLTSACRQWLGNVIVALCMTLVLVLQFNLLFEHASVLLVIVVMLALAAGGKFGQFSVTVFAALIIGAFIDSRVDHSRNSSEVVRAERPSPLPTIVHILLDEFIGPDGLPPQEAAQAYRSVIMEFFEENGFELYSRAYSHYHATQDSLAHAFNFTNDGDSLALKAEIFHSNLIVTENLYFEVLRQRGYTINIYQTDMVEFCQAAPEAVGRCLTYTTPNLESLREHVPKPLVRFRVLAIQLFRQSNIISSFLKSRLRLGSWGVSNYQPNVIDEIGDDMERYKSGVYFAHLLFPHEPYVHQNDCQLDYTTDPWRRFSSFPGLELNTEESRVGRYLLYLPQAECALKEVGRLMDRMRELDLYDNAIIVVHGDHGSRISLHSPHRDNHEIMTPEDYRDLYSTLFAVKYPGGEYREHTETVSLNVLLNQTAMRITGQDTSQPRFGVTMENVPFIYLSGQLPLMRQNIDIFLQQ